MATAWVKETFPLLLQVYDFFRDHPRPAVAMACCLPPMAAALVAYRFVDFAAAMTTDSLWMLVSAVCSYVLYVTELYGFLSFAVFGFFATLVTVANVLFLIQFNKADTLYWAISLFYSVGLGLYTIVKALQYVYKWVRYKFRRGDRLDPSGWLLRREDMKRLRARFDGDVPSGLLDAEWKRIVERHRPLRQAPLEHYKTMRTAMLRVVENLLVDDPPPPAAATPPRRRPRSLSRSRVT